MTWRVAKSLLHLRDQVNAIAPTRSKDSDGTIGDASHSSRESDHNPNAHGVVCAMDITHNPPVFDAYAYAEQLLASRDNRIQYVISNRKIASGNKGPSPWTWRRYTGASPHDHHTHLSVKQDPALYDLETDWALDGKIHAPVVNIPPKVIVVPTAARPLLRLYMHSDFVKEMQTLLNKKGAKLQADGYFGKRETWPVLIAFQKAHGLHPDGVCGRNTWVELLKA